MREVLARFLAREKFPQSGDLRRRRMAWLAETIPDVLRELPAAGRPRLDFGRVGRLIRNGT
jgi:hypothetical protein